MHWPSVAHFKGRSRHAVTLVDTVDAYLSLGHLRLPETYQGILVKLPAINCQLKEPPEVPNLLASCSWTVAGIQTSLQELLSGLIAVAVRAQIKAHE